MSAETNILLGRVHDLLEIARTVTHEVYNNGAGNINAHEHLYDALGSIELAAEELLLENK